MRPARGVLIMASMSTWTHKAPFRFGLWVFVAVLALTLAVASIAVARVDEFGGASTYAPFTEEYAGTDNIGPHVPENQIKKYAPYTELQPKPFWGQYLER